MARFDPATNLTEAQRERMENVREAFKDLACAIIENCNEGREAFAALTRLEDASHFAIKAITHTPEVKR